MVKIYINEKSFDVGIDFLKSIATSIPNRGCYSELLEELAQYPSVELRRSVSYNSGINEETAKLLLSDPDVEVVSNILSNEKSNVILTEENLVELLNRDDYIITEAIINNIDDFEDVDADFITDKIIELDNNWYCPKKILKKLSKNSDIDISSQAKESLK